MSHLKYPPSVISSCLAPIALSVVLIFHSGCTLVHIPSYRLEECAAESYTSPAADDPLARLAGTLESGERPTAATRSAPISSASNPPNVRASAEPRFQWRPDRRRGLLWQALNNQLDSATLC